MLMGDRVCLIAFTAKLIDKISCAERGAKDENALDLSLSDAD